MAKAALPFIAICFFGFVFNHAIEKTIADAARHEAGSHEAQQ